MLLSGSCLFHHSLYFSTSLYFIHHSLYWSIICPDIQVKRVLCGQIGVYESILQIHEANSFFLFIKKGALLFYTFCTRYCITISFFIEFLTSLNIKAPPYWNPVCVFDVIRDAIIFVRRVYDKPYKWNTDQAVYVYTIQNGMLSVAAEYVYASTCE